MFTGMQKLAPSEETRAAQRMITGPWSHKGSHLLPRQVAEVDFGPAAEQNVFDWIVPWFDYWLKGIQNETMDSAPVRLFVMGKNEWRNEQEWPLSRALQTEFYLHSDGSANTPAGDGSLTVDVPQNEPSDNYSYDPRDPVMTLFHNESQDEPHDQRVLDHRRDVLIYQTEPLDSPIEVTGVPQITLYASSSARDTDFTAKLIDVYPDGFSQDLCYGIVRARFREGFDTPKLLEPGVVYEYNIELMPTSNLFQKGHRIRVDISSSDFPNFDRNHNTGGDDYGETDLIVADQTVFHDRDYPSRITLPVVEG